jgi:hypothetical protein
MFTVDYFNACLAVVLMISITGCYIQNPEYPSAWPKIMKTTDVESQIEGFYSCTGEILKNGSGMWEMKSITDFLIGGRTPPVCEYLEISKVQPDSLEFRYFSSGVEIKKQIYKRDRDYHVQDNWIVLDSIVEVLAQNIVAVHASMTPYLITNDEQDLVVKVKNSDLGLIFVIFPSGTFGTEWGKFKRKK